MPCINEDSYRQRLLSGIIYYQMEKQKKRDNISEQRQEDIMNLTSLICSASDITILEKELVVYLKKMPQKRTWVQFFSAKQKESWLKELLMGIVSDENRKYNLSIMLMTINKCEPTKANSLAHEDESDTHAMVIRS